MQKLVTLLLIASVIMGCAQNFYTPYNENIRGTGRATIKLSAPMRDVSVTFNDSLIVDGKFTKRIVISDIPPGKYALKVIGTDGNRKSDLNYTDSLSITPRSHKTVLIETPPLSTGYWIYLSASLIASYWATSYLY